MKAITVRKLPGPVAKAVQDKARKERRSLNQTVVSLLEEATGHAPKKNKTATLHHDLDRFFGGWTKEEADEFDRALREQRQIEPEMWK
jgi:hypothetical protein